MDYTRQHDLAPPDRLAALEAHVIGLGGIGSPTALLLAKLGVGRIIGYDYDRVEEVNLPSQLYRLEDARANRPKAEAMRQICGDFSEIGLEAVNDRAEGHPLGGIVIVGVDSMKTRAELFQCVVESPVEWLIDARMGAETGTIYTIPASEPESLLYYDSTLYTDEEGLDLACTNRAIVYNTFHIASLIGRQVKRIAMGQEVERRIDFDLEGLTLVVEVA